MRLYAIETGHFKLDGGAMFGVVPKALWERTNPADQHNRIDMSARSLLIEDGNHLILIDTGLGNKQSDKFFSHYALWGEHDLVTSLAKAGFHADDITDVVFTHLHFDHCGGAIRRSSKGDGFVPVFKNAIYWSNENHWGWATSPNKREKASFLKENLNPIERSERLHFVTKEKGVLSYCENLGFEVFFADGHTEKQMIPIINYKGQKIAFAADLIPTAGHIPLPYVMGYDIRPLLTLKEKELLSLATTYWLQGLELFEVSIITLIDNPDSEKIQDSIAQSISDLSIGDRSYSEFLFLINQNASSDGTFLPVLYDIEYVGLEDNSFRFADLLVEKAKSSTGGLFLRRNLAISGAEFKPVPIAITEDDYSVLLNEKIELQIVLTNEGNVDAYDIVILILVTDEYGDTVYEQQSKIDSIGPQESRIFYSDAINIEPGVLHEWFIKLEEVEKEEDLNDNLFSVFGFIPPEG